MAQPTRETLLGMALDRVPAGRNNAGFWLAQQIHANEYAEGDAEALLIQFADATGLPHSEARNVVKAEYRRQPLAPWKGKEAEIGHIRRPVRLTAPPPARVHEIDPVSVAGFEREYGRAMTITGTPAEAYLAGRGIPEVLAYSACCKYAAEWGIIGAAVVFPILNEAGEPIAANGRAIRPVNRDKKQRTFGPKSLGIFYTPGALAADPVAITEAPIDALTLHLAGLPAIAICGNGSLAPWVMKCLAKPITAGYSRTVFLAYDNDPAGDTMAERIARGMFVVAATRLRPKHKDWSQDLAIGGLDSLRKWLNVETM